MSWSLEGAIHVYEKLIVMGGKKFAFTHYTFYAFF